MMWTLALLSLMVSVPEPPASDEIRRIALASESGSATALIVSQRPAKGRSRVHVDFELELKVEGEPEQKNEAVRVKVGSIEIGISLPATIAIEPLAAQLYEERGLLVITRRDGGLISYWFQKNGEDWHESSQLTLFPFPLGPGNQLPFESVTIEMYELPGDQPKVERGRIMALLPLYNPNAPSTFVFHFWFDDHAKPPFFAMLGRGVSIADPTKLSGCSHPWDGGGEFFKD